MLVLVFPADTVLQVATGRRRRLGTGRQIDKCISLPALGY